MVWFDHWVTECRGLIVYLTDVDANGPSTLCPDDPDSFQILSWNSFQNILIIYPEGL
jgi:hypothetical protein